MKTLRDEFAAHALQGLIARSSPYDNDYRRQAEKAYDYADAMLEARKINESK